MDNIDILNILIDPEKCKTTCFLCFVQSENFVNINDEIEIVDEYSNISMSFSEIMMELFPKHEIILQQVCEKCLQLVINMYIILRRHEMKLNILKKVTDAVNREIDRNTTAARESTLKKLMINMNLSNFDEKLDKVMENAPCEEEYSKNIEENQFKCIICDIKFESKDLYQEHTSKSHYASNKSTVCDFCGKGFRSPSVLRAHLKGHKTKQCPYCFKLLKNHSYFSVHVKNHQRNSKRERKKKYYNCHNCDYKSFHKDSLEAHINKVHLLIRPYVCDVCLKGFYKKSHLSEHMIMHKKLNNEICEICGESFVSQKTLSIHLKLHSENKSYKCSVCDKSFVTSGHRLEHFKRNHGAKSECCLVCGKKYGLKKDLIKHMRKKHTQKVEH